MHFAVPVDHRMKIKENEKRDKYLDLAREFRKLWTMMVTVILIVTDTLRMGTEKVGNRMMNRGRPDYSIIEISQNTEKSPEETCCHSNFSERWSAYAGVKNLQGVK